MKTGYSKALVVFMLIALLVGSSGCIFFKLNAMFAHPVPTPAAWTNGLFADYYYQDNELYDRVGSNNGAAFNTMLTTDYSDNLTNAYYFNGSNSYIQTVHPMQDLTNATFSLWFKANLTGNKETLLSDADSASSNYCKIVLVSDGSIGSWYKRHNSIGIYIVANKNRAGNGIIITNGIGKFRQIIINKWVNRIWVMTPTNQQVYVNGVQVANVFATANDVGFHGNGLVIGADDSTNPYQNFFSGSIDNITIYNRAISSSEASQFYDMWKP
jgi:Concanavalin A-like lectin/glucanases superfamily